MTKPWWPHLRMLTLMAWHGLFAGAYTIAFITAEGSLSMHRFAGYAALSLLVFRLGLAPLAADNSPWGLPWPTASAWKALLAKLSRGQFTVFKGRTPLFPLSALAILGTAVLAVLSGLLADAVDAEDMHEGLANLSLAAVGIHLAVMALAQGLKSLSDTAGLKTSFRSVAGATARSTFWRENPSGQGTASGV